jgi:hypothetical protein
LFGSAWPSRCQGHAGPNKSMEAVDLFGSAWPSQREGHAEPNKQNWHC